MNKTTESTGLHLTEGDLARVRGDLQSAAWALELSHHPDADLIAHLRATAEALMTDDDRATRDEMRARLAAKRAVTV